MEERTKRESVSRRREEKWQTLWCCRDQQRACRMAQASAEKLEHTGPAEKERVASVPQREQLARTPEPPLPKALSSLHFPHLSLFFFLTPYGTYGKSYLTSPPFFYQTAMGLRSLISF